MKARLLTLVILLTSIIYSQAKICRVGYNGIQLSGTDFNNFNDAQNACVNDDTIQIYGRINPITISKRLVVIGFGYNYDVHPELNVLFKTPISQSLNKDAPSNISVNYNTYGPHLGSPFADDILDFSPGSENSILVGLYINRVRIDVTGIKFIRCRIDDLYFIQSNELTIQGCIVNNTYPDYMQSPCTNIKFINCILNNLRFGNNLSTIVISNCVNSINGTSNFSDAQVSVSNSIFTSFSYNNINTIYYNVIFTVPTPNPLPYGNNMLWNQSLSNLYERLNANSDNPGEVNSWEFDENYFKLKAGSPAINFGFDAANNPTDCGIFGGEPTYHYQISGMPPVPAIYQLDAPGNGAATTNPYNITISVKSKQ